ncbi:serum paraoxonase/arylesterase 2-like [Protopterus annectens]|uniref:serum paraoxonase/arylesterase 2-like n=1 Tax=Protopterus annectens TaxID=7888 RepID=UPI001CFC1B8B|nr:serum paraoxonase/arylesterase 2-like [Protopterus annectens]
MGKLLTVGVVLGGLLGLLSERFLTYRSRLLYDREPENKDLPNCRLIEGIEYGSEDLVILPNGLTFISSGLKSPILKSFAPDRPGEIFLLDLNEADPKPVVLKISDGFDVSSFNPHGVSAHIEETDNVVYVFVVNHPHGTSTVEIFKFEEENNYLLHLKTIKHELLPSIDDIVALGPESFYATVDYYFANFIMQYVEILLGLPWSSVVYYSPTDVKEVACGFYFTNGINISPARKYIYIADSLDHSIHIMGKDDNNSLTPVKVIPLETIPRSIDVDPVTGNLWVGCLPNCWKLFNYDPESPPGSEVILIQNILSDEPVVTQVYANNGSVLQGSSVAAVYEKKLIVGTGFHKALLCDLSEPEHDVA